MLDKNIVLIGMPGCGKSTIGKILSQKLEIEFCDVDEYIEKIQGKTIQEIFKNGEDYFRDIESKAGEELSRTCSKVISTGGGVIKKLENIDTLKKNGIIIFINRPLENIISDVDVSKRPLLKEGKEKIYKLYKERYDLYKKYCDYEIMNDDKLEEVVSEIESIFRNI